MTNGERADRLFADALPVAEEMRAATARQRWNLALRRSQEVIELVIKALLNELGVESPRVHDPVPFFVTAIRARRLEIDSAFLEWLSEVSARLAQERAPAFYQEIDVTESEARETGRAAERVLEFGQELLRRLRSRA